MGDDLSRAGWWRDYQKDAWMHGRYGITDEVIARYPRDKVQQFAMQMTGERLPDEAFPPPEPQIVTLLNAIRQEGETAAQAMDRMVLALLRAPQ